MTQKTIDNAVDILEEKITKKYRRLRRLRHKDSDKRKISQLEKEIADLKNELDNLIHPDQQKFEL